MAGASPEITISKMPTTKVAIITASWHPEVCDALVSGARRACSLAEVAEVEILTVAGSFELPLAAQFAFQNGAKKYWNKPENRKKLIERMTGDLNPAKTADSRRKIGEKHKGKIITADQRKRISEGTKLAMANPEVRAKCRERKIGIKQSIEHRTKNSIAVKEWWRKRKLAAAIIS